MITNNFNTNIHFINSRNFNKRVLYIKTEVVVLNSNTNINYFSTFAYFGCTQHLSIMYFQQTTSCSYKYEEKNNVIYI